jgi:membrane-associated protease RseP (regulator of RpoE activity)
VAVVATALFIVALLAHELAHALVARHYGIRVRDHAVALGGVAATGRPRMPAATC